MRISFLLKSLSVALILLSFNSFAQIRYQASIDPSSKKLWSSNGDRLSCSLVFDIPEYGFANFMTYSGRTPHSALAIHPRLGIGQSSYMRFISTKPEWHSVSSEKLLGKIELYPGFNPYIGPTLSWKILSELSHGNQIMMPYTDDKLAPGENIIPVISPLGFKSAFKRYLACQEQLIRVNFNDIKMLPLVFKAKSHELTAKSLNMLNEQLEYIKLDKSIIKVVIRAYAYDMEKNADNVLLARERAESLKKYYLDAGVNEDIINIIPFNELTLNTREENPLADQSVTSRNALITIDRDNAMINKDMEINIPDVGANTGY
ncbi:MAG: OmpA family protein [Succinivibrio sp.]